MKLIWGKARQLHFTDDTEYFTALGIFANPDLAKVYIEDNAKRGSFTDAYRIQIRAEARKCTLPAGVACAMKNAGRINCNEYVDNLRKNHGFILSGNVVTATLENVLNTIPDEAGMAAFMKGYYLLQSEESVQVNKITYSTESIDVSGAALVESPVPVIHAGPAAGKKKQGKRDYIQLAIRDFEIGEAGERMVYEHEKHKLLEAVKAGKITDLKGKLEWVSRTDDSRGYDIKSYDADRQEPMYIEVKTTAAGASTPFYMSENELQTSQRLGDRYYIYRLYNVNRSKPEKVGYYILKGDISKNKSIQVERQDYVIRLNKR